MNGALHLMLETNSLFSFDVKEVAAKLLIYRRKMCHISSNILGNLEVVFFFFRAYDDKRIQIWMLQNFEAGEWVLKHTCYRDNMLKHPVVPFPNLAVGSLCLL